MGYYKPITTIASIGPAGPIAGTNTQIVYNDNGAAAGSPDLIWDGTLSPPIRLL